MNARLKKKKAVEFFSKEVAGALSRQYNAIAEIKKIRTADTHLINITNNRSCELEKQLETSLPSIKRTFKDVYWWIKLFIFLNAIMLFGISYCITTIILL